MAQPPPGAAGGARLDLPGSGASTTRLGFGCAYLMPETAGLLDVAYEAGVRHFDVARAYGRGGTELLVGEFLKRRPDATVTTKYGILPPIRAPWQAKLRRLARPLVRLARRSPALAGGLTAVTPATEKARFTIDEARRSLDASLRSLGRDRVELFLMHEAAADDLGDPRLLDFLQELQVRGMIGAFGVGGRAERLPELLRARPEYCRVLQFDWTAAESPSIGAGVFCLVYRTMGERLRAWRDRLVAEPAQVRRWSDAVGLDLSVPGRIETLMLKAALVRRPGAVVLFSSGNPEHIRANAAAAADDALEAPALRLAERFAALAGTGCAA